MQKGDYLTTILRSAKTVFTSRDIAILWQDPGSSATRVRISYYVKKGDLIRLRKGLYVKNKDYNKLELATRIFTPSYRKISIDDQVYSFKTIKNNVLTNSLGIENINETSIASKERAFLDTLYVNNNYYFDNLRSLDWEKVFQILPIYSNHRMVKKIKQLHKSL